MRHVVFAGGVVIVLLAASYLFNLGWKRLLRPLSLSGDVERVRRWRRYKFAALFVCFLPFVIYIFATTNFTGPKYFAGGVELLILLSAFYPDLLLTTPELMNRLTK